MSKVFSLQKCVGLLIFAVTMAVRSGGKGGAAAPPKKIPKVYTFL